VSVTIEALTTARKCCFMCPFVDVEILHYASKFVAYKGVIKDGNFSPTLH
jgi:hypothetical protein